MRSAKLTDYISIDTKPSEFLPLWASRISPLKVGELVMTMDEYLSLFKHVNGCSSYNFMGVDLIIV